MKLSTFFEEENIIEYSKNTTWKEISSLCIIIASIETERQKSLISKCKWIDILNRINLNHSAQIKSIANILYYQNKKQVILNLPLANQEIIIYLEKNREEIVRFSTKYFISPDDFQSCSNLLGVLLPHSSEICRNIADKIKYKIIMDFKISPKYYQSFSNLLNTINQVNPTFNKYIIADNSVKSKLHASFEDKSIKNQLEGVQSLLDSIKNIDRLVESEILALQSIKDLKLDGIVKDRTNENLNSI